MEFVWVPAVDFFRLQKWQDDTDLWKECNPKQKIRQNLIFYTWENILVFTLFSDDVQVISKLFSVSAPVFFCGGA